MIRAEAYISSIAFRQHEKKARGYKRANIYSILLAIQFLLSVASAKISGLGMGMHGESQSFSLNRTILRGKENKFTKNMICWLFFP